MIRIAHVGAFKRASEADTSRTIAVMGRVIARDGKWLRSGGPVRHDVVNLIYDRDFLSENVTYDIVILHSIYDGPPIGVGKRECRRSPLHEVARWRERLVATRARWIGVCEGQPMSLSGWLLGELPGYERTEADTMLCLYQQKGEGGHGEDE